MQQALLDNTEETKAISFEDFKNENGMIFWWATDFMKMLGYDNLVKFEKVINKTTSAFLSLGVKHYENIIPVNRKSKLDGKEFKDFKLTRFACYLAAMNADSKKKEVALAQAYFAEQTRKFEVYIQGTTDVDRLLYREELKKSNTSLAGAAKEAGVSNYTAFVSKGYYGLYNMLIVDLKRKKGIPRDGAIPDYMGRTELAANLFRVTQTEERLKKDKTKGQIAAEKAHFEISQRVRKLVIENTGKTPEELQVERKLPEVKKEFKKGMKALQSLDKKDKTKPKKII